MIKIFPLDFLGQGALLQPKDQRLHDMAVDYLMREVTGDVNLASFNRVFIAAEVDESGEPVKVEGVTGFCMRPDIALYRATSAAATAKLHHRWHTYFADNGLLGQEVFLHLSDKESPEQRCSNWNQEMMKAEAVPADRYLVKVRAK